MTDDLFERFVVEPQERNPVRAAQREMRRPLPKRFYVDVRAVAHPDGFVLSLDGKFARTPKQRPLVLPTRSAGDAVAAEWACQGEHLDPALMPLTRIVNAAIDGVADHMREVAADIVKFGASDLICYRAAEPEGLVALESAAWDPVLAWAEARLGGPLIVSRSLAFVEQAPAVLAALSAAVSDVRQPIALAALHTMTTLCGSALLALAVADGFLTSGQAWTAAHVDDDFQMRLWGEDDEALARKAGRWREMSAAARLYAALAL